MALSKHIVGRAVDFRIHPDESGGTMIPFLPADKDTVIELLAPVPGDTKSHNFNLPHKNWGSVLCKGSGCVVCNVLEEIERVRAKLVGHVSLSPSVKVHSRIRKIRV